MHLFHVVFHYLFFVFVVSLLWNIILSVFYSGSHKTSPFQTKYIHLAIAVPERTCQVLSIPVLLPRGPLFFKSFLTKDTPMGHNPP